LMFGAMSAPHIHGLSERDKTTFKRLYSDDPLVKEALKRNPIENIAKLNTHPVTREGRLLQKLAEGGEYMQKGEWLQAIKCYTEANELDSTDKLVLNDLGAANVRHGLELANSGDLDGAGNHLQKALKAYKEAGNDERGNAVQTILVRVRAKEASLPKPYIALLQAGINQARAGTFDQAVATLSDAIKLSPEHAGAWCLRAQCYLQLHKTDAALADAVQALKLEPADSQVLRVRGLVAEQQHDDVEAAKFLTAAVAAEPAGQDVYLDLAALLTHQRKWDKSVDLLTDAIAKHPKCGGCYGSRALSRLALKEAERAISDMQMALALEPNNAALWFDMGAIDVARDQYSQAVLDFSRAISLKPSDPDAYKNRAGAYKLMKLMDKAHEDEATATRLSRNDTALFHVKVGDVTVSPATKSGATP
jgi:tetratricopeptide (TPR) repeat protein